MALWRSAVRSRLGPPKQKPPPQRCAGVLLGLVAGGYSSIMGINREETNGMPVALNLVLSAVIGAVFLTLVAGAQAETACNETVVRDRLAAMEKAFRQPDMQAKLSAAQKDWLDDNDFDDEENAKKLAVVAAYHQMKRNCDGGAVDGACESLARTDAMVRAVLGNL